LSTYRNPRILHGDTLSNDFMTEFATRPLPFTFMPAIPMANRRPKRKSGNSTYLDEALEDTRREDIHPPLKKTKRPLPDEHDINRGHEPISISQARV
jgi:hypothetical protein